MLVYLKNKLYKKRFKRGFKPRWVKKYVIFINKLIKKYPKFKKLLRFKLKKKIRNEKYLFFFRKKFFFLKKRINKLQIYFEIFCLKQNSLFYKLRKKILKRKLLKSFVSLDILNYYLELKNLKFTFPISFPNIFFEEGLQKKKLILTITIHSNNIFINLSEYFMKKIKTIFFLSAGMFSFACSKKKLKFAISTFFKKLRKQFKILKIYAIKIKAPKYLNKYLFKQLKYIKFIKSKFIIYTSFKIFNGCRCKKKRRKKRLKFRNFR